MLKEKILAAINEMEAGDLIHLWNEYCETGNAFDDLIYSMDDLDMLCDGQGAHWIACRIFYGDFNPNDDFIAFDGYGNFRTLNEYNLRGHIYVDDIADYIERKRDSLYNDEIQDILDAEEGGARKCLTQ